MNGPTTTHDTVRMTRTYDAAAERVFAAWSQTPALSRWYVPGDGTWDLQVAQHEFRVGGRKHLIFGPKTGPRYSEDCRYEDIVEGRRICFSMTIANETTRLTTSMVTVELIAKGERTDLILTDQVVILDGSDGPTGAREREKGWGETIDKLYAELARA